MKDPISERVHTGAMRLPLGTWATASVALATQLVEERMQLAHAHAIKCDESTIASLRARVERLDRATEALYEAMCQTDQDLLDVVARPVGKVTP